MNRYKYRFSGKIFAVTAVGLLLAAVCLILNIVRLVNLIAAESVGIYTIISVAVAIIMSVAFIVIIIAMLADSRYIFEKNFLVTKFGFIRNTTDYKTIKQIVWFKEVNKLTVFYDDERFANIVISDGEYQAFAEELRSHNPNIIYFEDITSENK